MSTAMKLTQRRALSRWLVHAGLLAAHRDLGRPVGVGTLEVRLRMRRENVRGRLAELESAGLAWQPRVGRWLPGTEGEMR